MSDRKPLSKRVRFEVFKRDAFTCQYCGAHPPGVLLHADHIVPVAEGGGDEIDNLITACEPCNLGKGARSLQAVPSSLRERAELVAEREEQIRGYQDVIEAARRRVESEIDRVAEVFERYDPGYTLGVSWRTSTRRFIERLGVHSVIDAMEIAGSRFGHCRSKSKMFSYFCGVCWGRIRDAEGGR